MKIIADENIPLVKELFSPLGDVILLSGREITPAMVKDAEILLVRSITAVNENLLGNSTVKFVGTATTGTDHIDSEWLKKHNIFFADAKGSNAIAVAEYVIACVAALQLKNLLPKHKIRAGIIGVGHVGTKVLEKLQVLDFEILLNDPLRAAQENNFISTPLTKLYDVDLLCLHTPLTHSGSFPTFHLIDKNFLKKLKPGCVLLNASRGAVINFGDLKQYGRHLVWCFDVWEDEPNIELNILKQAAIATPHIAGYTAEAKLHGALMLYQAAQKFFKFPAQTFAESLFPKIELPISTNISWQESVLQTYNPITDTLQLRAALLPAAAKVAPQFDELRKHHLKRHEFASIILKGCSQLKNFDLQILERLGFNCKVD